MQFGWHANDTSARIMRLAVIAALIFLVIYSILYVSQPFSDVWNTILSNLFLIVAASLTALVGTWIWNHYETSDAPRRVWSTFAIGLWLWAVAELIWGYLNVSHGEVSEGISDVFWISAYLFFAQALLTQYRILAHPTAGELWRRILIAILLFLALYLLIYGLLASSLDVSSRFGAAINSFYPAADLLLVLVALWLSRRFRGGIFSRPWLGLLAFSFADLLYAWIEISGLYSWSVNQANLLSTISDIVYLSAYLILGLGLLSQWVFLKYGLRPST